MTPLDNQLAAYWATASGGALSNASLAEHLTFLAAEGHVRSGARVLCVGVGTGGWMRELAARGCLCAALDIAPAALARVQPFAQGYLSPRGLPDEAFDLALSHWVSPHMPADALREQIVGVVRSLAPSGIFALHFNEAAGTDPRRPMDVLDALLDARALYNRKQIAEWAAEAGGRVLRQVAEQPDPERARTLCAVHIGR